MGFDDDKKDQKRFRVDLIITATVCVLGMDDGSVFWKVVEELRYLYVNV